MLFDVFICHASEDKDDFVRPLAEALAAQHLEVWYDETSVQLGESLREAIDRGLSRSRHGVVVLSEAFFAKQWTQRELNGLVARQMQGEDRVILPVWHRISASKIVQHSPPLADLKAVDSVRGLHHVCSEILKSVRPQESPLIAARDELIAWGMSPPVITSEWWLDVVEASNRVPAAGAHVPESATWGRWSFPLPGKGDGGRERGTRLAWTAMQLDWVREADERPVTQITPPGEVLSFIEQMPGLFETCQDYPRYLAMYAPQLSISGLGGAFEKVFDELAENSGYDEMDIARFSRDEHTTPEPVPPEYAGRLASDYAIGSGVFGPSTATFETFDYSVWLYAAASGWLPNSVRDALRLGFRECWAQRRLVGDSDADDALAALPDRGKAGRISQAAFNELALQVELSLSRMSAVGDARDIAQELVTEGFLEARWRERRRRGKRT